MFLKPPAVPDPPARPRRWPLRILVGIIAVLVLVWALPILVAWTPLAGWACAKAESYIDGTVRVGNISLGWFSSVVLYNVDVADADGNSVVHLSKIQTSRSLLRLLLDRDDLGTIRIDKLKADVVVTGNDSNVERLLARLLHPPAPEKADPPAPAPILPRFEIEVTDGSIAIRDADSKRTWPISGVDANAAFGGASAGAAVFRVEGTLHDRAEAGEFKIEGQVNDLMNPTLGATLKVKFSSMPLGLADVGVRRVRPDVMLAGSLHGQGDLTVESRAGKLHFKAAGTLTGNRVTVRAPRLREPLYLEQVQAPWSVKLEDEKWTAQSVEVHSDLGKISMQGTFDLAKPGLAGIDQPGFDLALDVNLATLATRLPKTLHVHPDLRLTDGTLHAECKSQIRDGSVVWQGKLNTSDVRGLKGNETIAWTEPITVQFQARDLAKGVPMIDELKCAARFLRVEATQSPDRFALHAEADLDQLAAPLRQIVDMHGVNLAGKATADIVVRRLEEDRFQAQGNALLTQLHVTGWSKVPWQEGKVVAKFDAKGRIDKDGAQRVDAADVALNLGADSASLKLTEPVVNLATGPWGAADVRVDGDLARWRNRARSVTSLLDDYATSGQATIQGKVRITQQSLDFSSANIQATNFGFTGLGLRIQEPTFNIQTAARWDASTGALELTRTRMVCPTLQIDSGKLTIHPASAAASGSVGIAGDLARLRKWTQDPAAKPGTPLQGSLAGMVHLQTAENRYAADFDVNLKNVVYGPVANPTWREPAVKLAGRGGFDRTKDTLTLEKVQLAGATLRADARGTIANATTAMDLDLSGNLTYDLEKLEPQLRPYLGKDVKIVGKDTRGFQLTGPLYPRAKGTVIAVSKTGAPVAQPSLRFTELKGHAGVHWKSLRSHGCDVGPAEVKAIIQQGWLQVYPIETTLNAGKLRLQPNLRLDPDPMEIVLLAGPMIEKARITPAMCAGALGYALPALANVAQAEGMISVTLDGGRIPLAAPVSGELKGTLVLHAAKIGPSPLLRELGAILKTPAPTSLVKESRVPFHMVGGKVHHRDLELIFTNFTMKSSGAVGLDGSLALVIETPIPPALAVAARLTPAQAKQTIRIPVGGTLNQPRPDPRALESITSVIGRSLLENELRNLFNPKK